MPLLWESGQGWKNGLTHEITLNAKRVYLLEVIQRGGQQYGTWGN